MFRVAQVFVLELEGVFFFDSGDDESREALFDFEVCVVLREESLVPEFASFYFNVAVGVADSGAVGAWVGGAYVDRVGACLVACVVFDATEISVDGHRCVFTSGMGCIFFFQSIDGLVGGLIYHLRDSF